MLICVSVASLIFADPTYAIQLASNATGQDEYKTQWVKMKPTAISAQFEMPIKPRFVERRFAPIQDKPPVVVRLHLATINAGTMTYIFGYHDLHEAPKDTKAINAALDGAIRGAVANVLGQLSEKPTSFSQPGLRYGREFAYQFAQGEKIFQVAARVFLHGRRQYQVTVVMAEDIYDENLVRKYFKSFQLVIPEHDLPPRPRTSK